MRWRSSPSCTARFDPERRRLLAARQERQERLDAGERPDFLAETRDIRESDWQVAPAPADLQDRRVEITGPVDRKMVINALNSGARVFMADFEDANSPTWSNNVEGQINLRDAAEGTIDYDTGEKYYELVEDPAVLVVRPRGWHLLERHVHVDGESVSGSLFDFGLYVFHNPERPWFYIPKLESHLEARLWNQVFDFAEEALRLEPGSIKATVLIENVLAAFEMDEILYELREHIVGLNAGRWDYLFSLIKRLRSLDVVLPDRGQLTMTTPFMRAYTELLVKTCHRRGAHAMGGMAAFIPSRRDPEVNERALAKVREDKVREAGDGFDGTWVAHPDLVPVATEVFDAVLGDAAEPGRAAARRGVGLRVGPPRPARRGRRRHRGGAAPERQRGDPLHRVVAPRGRRGCDRQPDGGRSDRGDLAVAGLAVGARRQVHAGAGARGHGRGDARGRTVRGGTRDLRTGGAERRLRRVPDASGLRVHRLRERAMSGNGNGRHEVGRDPSGLDG